MFQTLFYIPCEIGDWPVFGFGLLLVAWLVGCAGVLAWLVRRQGFSAETRGQLPLMIVVAVVIAWLLPAICEPRGLPIRGYGMMVLLAVVSGLGLAVWRARRAGVDHELIFALAFWMILPGIVGARTIYVTEYWSDQYWPIYQEKGLPALLGAIVNLTSGGLVVYGAFLGGVVGLVAFWWKQRFPLLSTADLVAPSLALGAGIGRIGCILNGCCFGGPCDLDWGVQFPWNSPPHVHQITHGEAAVLGMKLVDGPDGLATVDQVEPDSIAERAGVKSGRTILEVNGVPVQRASDARWNLLGIDKLRLDIRAPDRTKLAWVVDPPSDDAASDAAEPGDAPVVVRIYGLRIAGRPGDKPIITRVRWQSPEAMAGLAPGQVIERAGGRPVATIGDLRRLLAEHRDGPWADLKLRAPWPPVTLLAPRPLPQSLKVHPTQLYSAVDGVLLCLVLLAYSPFRRRDGELAALLVTIYPITRFMIERIRTDEPNILGTGMHISQNISLLILIAAAGLWIYILRQPRRKATK